ncbi:histidine kinase [Paenibacillus sp. P26]|nr:histidine kinase [Paenibacillus sp. P26]
MRALQAQINPHFLYNTLSSIHWIALLTEEKRIADMVGALSDFLRFSLNKGKEFCPVHQELSHIRNYVQVQSIRFPDQFDVDIVADPELQDKLMLKYAAAAAGGERDDPRRSKKGRERNDYRLRPAPGKPDELSGTR